MALRKPERDPEVQMARQMHGYVSVTWAACPACVAGLSLPSAPLAPVLGHYTFFCVFFISKRHRAMINPLLLCTLTII